MKPNERTILVGVLGLLCVACISGRPPKWIPILETSERTVSFQAWMKVRGELMFYPTRLDMDYGSKYPKCISGVSLNHDPKKYRELQYKMVDVEGELVDYSGLPSEDYIIGRKLLHGSVIPNFCFGKRVLLVRRVSLAR